jgi:hypothetical protein
VPDWDEDSPQLRQNLTRILEEIADDSKQRKAPTVEMARRWQMLFMHGLKPTNPQYVGKFRGEAGLEKTRVKIGANWGVPPARVAEELQRFQQKLQAAVAQLDKVLPVGGELDRDYRYLRVGACGVGTNPPIRKWQWPHGPAMGKFSCHEIWAAAFHPAAPAAR